MIALVEEPDFEPTEEEVRAFASSIGIDILEDVDLIDLACAGIKAPLPDGWQAWASSEGILYQHVETGDVSWEHPADQYYKELYLDIKKGIRQRCEPWALIGLAGASEAQVTAATAAAGMAVFGASGGAAGALFGGATGAAAGVLPALFTFGISIPVCATLGAGVGLCAGTATGAGVGLVGGGAGGYGACRYVAHRAEARRA